MGGSIGGTFPGSVGFTYARTNNPAPSNGPYAKKTKASAQDGKNLHPIDLHLPIYEKPKPSLNPYAFYEHPQQDVHIAGIGAHAQGDINNRLNLSGGLHSTSVSYPGGKTMFMKPEYHVGMKYRFDNGGSMSYYQHGLDWKPKSMEEGGWLEKYEVPKNQNAQYTLPRFDMPRAASESTSAGISKKDVELLDELAKRKQFEKYVTNQPQFKQGKKSTPESEARRKMLNQQYVNTHPYAKLNSEGDLERTNWDRSMEGVADAYTPAAKVDRGMTTLANGLEAAGYVTGAGELAGAGYSALKNGLAESMESGVLSKVNNFINPAAPTDLGEAIISKKQLRSFNPETGSTDVYSVDVPDRIVPGRSFEDVAHKMKNLRKDLGISPIEDFFYKRIPKLGPKIPLDKDAGMLIDPETGRLFDSNTRYWLNRQYGHTPSVESLLEPRESFIAKNYGKRLFSEEPIKKSSLLNSSVENVGSKLKSQTAGTDYIWNHVNKNIKGNLPEGLTKQHVADILENNLNWIESPEYLKRRMATAGESAEQVTKNVQALKKRFKNTKIEFTNKGLGKNYGTYSGNSSNLISNIRKDVIKIKPDLSLEEMIGTIDHEVGHALSPAIKNEKLYKNYPELSITEPEKRSFAQEFFNLKPYSADEEHLNYLGLPEEQQVRAIRLNNKVREDLGLPQTEPVSEEQFGNWVENHYNPNLKKLHTSGFNDVTDLLDEHVKAGGSRSSIYNWLNKAWGVVPAVGVAATMQKKKQGGIIKDDMGQWAHPGEITEIQGNNMATHGYGDMPLYVVPNVGKPRVVEANTGNHTFPGATKFTEYPMKKNGGWLDKYK
jgi:hypothetical protein